MVGLFSSAQQNKQFGLDFQSGGVAVVQAGELRDVEAYLSDAQESLQRQVILETKIIEVRLNDGFQAGIDWAALSRSGNVLAATTGIINGRNVILDSLSDLNLSDNTDVTNLFALGTRSSNFAALIRLLSTQDEVRVLSSPRVSTINNHKAVIKVGSLFKQQSKRNNRSELVILLRPVVVDSSKTWSDYIKDSASRMEKLKYVESAGE